MFSTDKHVTESLFPNPWKINKAEMKCEVTFNSSNEHLASKTLILLNSWSMPRKESQIKTKIAIILK